MRLVGLTHTSRADQRLDRVCAEPRARSQEQVVGVDSIARDRPSGRLGLRRKNDLSGIRTRPVRAKLMKSWRLERRLLAAARQAHAGSCQSNQATRCDRETWRVSEWFAGRQGVLQSVFRSLAGVRYLWPSLSDSASSRIILFSSAFFHSRTLADFASAMSLKMSLATCVEASDNGGGPVRPQGPYSPWNEATLLFTPHSNPQRDDYSRDRRRVRSTYL